jgi:hypothetical protein
VVIVNNDATLEADLPRGAGARGAGVRAAHRRRGREGPAERRPVTHLDGVRPADVPRRAGGARRRRRRGRARPRTEPVDVDWVSGWRRVVHARGARERGLSSTSAFFAYHEDVDWCTTARQRGYHVLYAPGGARLSSRRRQHGGVQRRRRRPLSVRAATRCCFARKHASPGEAPS